MSELSDSAKAAVIMADYANDAAGKLNLLGAHWGTTGIQSTGMVPPQSVVILIEIPSRFYGHSVALSVTLHDDAGDPVQLPGQPGALRVQQVFTVQRPTPPGMYLATDLPAKIQVALNFPTGLPLQAGRQYEWRLEIDGNHRDEWSASFYVAGPPPAPVVG